jgi:hypothetical protein
MFRAGIFVLIVLSISACLSSGGAIYREYGDGAKISMEEEARQACAKWGKVSIPTRRWWQMGAGSSGSGMGYMCCDPSFDPILNPAGDKQCLATLMNMRRN